MPNFFWLWDNNSHLAELRSKNPASPPPPVPSSPTPKRSNCRWSLKRISSRWPCYLGPWELIFVINLLGYSPPTLCLCGLLQIPSCLQNLQDTGFSLNVTPVDTGGFSGTPFPCSIQMVTLPNRPPARTEEPVHPSVGCGHCQSLWGSSWEASLAGGGEELLETSWEKRQGSLFIWTPSNKTHVNFFSFLYRLKMRLGGGAICWIRFSVF